MLTIHSFSGKAAHDGPRLLETPRQELGHSRAQVILSQTKAFDTCEKMETVANLQVPRCDLDNRIKGLMPGDIAFLKAFYKADTGGTLVAQQFAITSEMKKLLNAS